MQNYRYMVSVIVLTYNPSLDKLKDTLISLLKQRDVNYEIIVADDGSKNNYFAEVKACLEKYNCENYVLVEAAKNTGTCENYMRGLKRASGKYIKAISPGDLLFEETTLCKWVSFMEEHKSKVSFGKVVYYNNEDGFKINKVKWQPQRRELYYPDNYKENAVIFNYICLLDPVVGSALLVENATLYYYLNLLIGKVMYSEDNMFRIMVFDKIHLDFFDETIILYEYGMGISTNSSNKWAKIIKQEIIATNRIIVGRLKKTSFYNLRMRVVLSLPFKSKIYTISKYILFPSLIYWQFVKKKNVHYSEGDESEIELCFNNIKSDDNTNE